MKTTLEKLKKCHNSLEDRGLMKGSFFEATFKDKTNCHEKDYSWYEMSTEKKVKYQGMTKTVFICNHKISHIRVTHEGKQVELDVPDDCEVYQAMRSETSFSSAGRKDRTLGRVVGLIRDDEVIEEYFINGLQRCVLGFRK